MVRCSIIDCKSDSDRKIIELSFHSFPTKQSLRDVWVAATGRKGWEPKKGSKICSKHFDTVLLVKRLSKTYLDFGAVPTKLIKCAGSTTNDDPLPSASLMDIDNNRDENILEPILPAPSTEPKAQKPSASTSCGQEKKTKVSSSLPIIAKVYLYLEKEYEYMKTLNGDNCDLSPLEDILRRTSEATDVSEEEVISILDAEDLYDHLPPRARSKRRKILQRSTGNDRENDDLIKDDDILQEENDNVIVKFEITEDIETEHGLTHSSCNMDYGTSDTDRTQVKSEPQEIVYPQTESLRYLEVSPLTSTYGSNNNMEYTTQTRVKLEREEDETMTGNLLLPKSNPSNEPTTSEPADTAIKLEPEDID